MKIYIHVGPPRTGTTSFQMLLSKIKNVDCTVLVPMAGLDINSYGCAHHGLLEYDDKYRSISLGEFKLRDSAYINLLSEISNVNDRYQTCILSSERFATLMWHELPRMRVMLEMHNVHFIFSKRNYFDSHKSLWNKRVELGWGVDLNNSISDIFPQLNYMNFILPRAISKIFGSEPVFVDYQKDPRLNLRALCTASGLTDSSFESFVSENEYLSESLSALEILQCLEANKIILKRINSNNNQWVPYEMLHERDLLRYELAESNRADAASINEKFYAHVERFYNILS